MSNFLAYATLCIVWGTTYLALKICLEGFSPYYMAGIRFLLAGLILLPALFRKGARFPTQKKEWYFVILSGILMLCGANGLVTWSEKYLDSGLTALTVTTNPAWAAIFGGLFFSKSERYGKWAIVGTALAILGVYVLHNNRLNFGHTELPGVLMACAAPIFWSLGSLVARKYIKEMDVLSAATIQMLSASLLFFPISLALGESWEIQLSARVVWAMLFLILFGSSLVYAVYVWLLQRMPASKVTTYTYVNPIVALFLGNLILQEPITPEIIPATLLILGGLAIIYFSKNPKPLTA